MSLYRQGDVLIKKVELIPENATLVKKNGDIVLAYGEATGHKHRITDETTKEYIFNVDTFLEVLNATNVIHEEHNSLTLSPGYYKVIRQKEYTPASIKNVID